MFRPFTKPKQKKEMKQKIIGISTIVIIAIIVGIVFAVNNSGSIEKLNFFDKSKVKALTSDTVEVKSIWAKGIGNTGEEKITGVAKTSDGGNVAVGYFFSESIKLGENISINNAEKDEYGEYNSNGMVIKYDSNGDVEWAKSIGNVKKDYINCVAGTPDGGIVVAGIFYSDSIDLGNGIYVGNNNSAQTGMIIKFNSDGICQWAKTFGGDEIDYANSICVATDGGIVIGGYSNSSALNLGNGIYVGNKNSTQKGMIIKFNSNGICQWATLLNGLQDSSIISVAGTSDNGIIVGGYAKDDMKLR